MCSKQHTGAKLYRLCAKLFVARHPSWKMRTLESHGTPRRLQLRPFNAGLVEGRDEAFAVGPAFLPVVVFDPELVGVVEQ